MNGGIGILDDLGSLFGSEPFFEQVSVLDMFINLLLAVVLSAFIAMVYKWSNRTAADKRIIMPSLVLLSMAIAAAMIVIGNNLARAFGLVGAVSIIRFRTSIKNSKDMAFVFIAIVVGMACGLKFRLIAILFTGVSGGVIALLAATRFGSRDETHKQFLLKLDAYKPDVPRRQIEECLNSCAAPWDLVEQTVTGKKMTVRYLLTLREDTDRAQLLRTLQESLASHDIQGTLSLRTYAPR